MAETASQEFPSSLGTTPVGKGSFATLAWGVTAYTWLVVLWGAVVRITGSGAGCGQHWPTCHGEIAHLPKTVETWIELGHRATSGLSFLAVVALVVKAVQAFPKGHRVRWAALAGLAFMIAEVLIGARLVLGRLVGADASIDRALVMPLHLVTTSGLLGALGLAAWWGRPARPAPAGENRTELTSARVLASFGAAVLGVLAVSATGAVTALGDTVFPLQSTGIAARLSQDQGLAAHFLERLRVIHPLVAVGVAGLLLYVTAAVGKRARSREALSLKALLVALVWLELAVGVVNVLLSAPGYMQVLHLAIATVLWLSLVLLAAAAFDEARGRI